MTGSPAPHLDGLPHYFAAGIGAGPANLSLAALFRSGTSESIALFDRQPAAGWHEGLLHSGVRMQTSWMKDLVSVVDPTHELSFLNYLVRNGRLFSLINAQFDVIPRREYMRYLAWAADHMDDVHYGHEVDVVTFEAGRFVVHCDEKPVATARHLVVGVGTQPARLPGLATLPAERSFVADDLHRRLPQMTEGDKAVPVAVIGGGQTGCECVLRLLDEGFTDIRWYDRSTWFHTIDDSPIANDVYRPSHVQFLQGLSRPTRRRLVEEMQHTGIALTPGAMRTLYQANYDRMLVTGEFPVTLLPGREVSGGALVDGEVALDVVSAEKREQHRVGYAVVAIGRVNTPVPLAPELVAQIDVDTDGEVLVGDDYAVTWKGMAENGIYALNRSMYVNGITDNNLTLLPVRAATVLNSMLGREVYTVSDDLSPVRWG
ncbi:SidA/IucD/PvdA family monooxygenase [Pseudonocardia sp. CA-107938]|uniref:SidA/IucD/PvdA family monooxygenase n=1 Tax=Pseudonocardia sp. CA-107938 TaxID=3240021 RepID=UPI003D8B5D3A